MRPRTLLTSCGRYRYPRVARLPVVSPIGLRNREAQSGSDARLTKPGYHLSRPEGVFGARPICVAIDATEVTPATQILRDREAAMSAYLTIVLTTIKPVCDR